MRKTATINLFVSLLLAMLLITFGSCKKEGVPWPGKGEVIATFIGTSFRHYTASEYNYDSLGNVVTDPVTHSFW
jgi:hypothetical protein